METCKNIYRSEIAGFKELGEKFLQGQLSVPEFKGKSGGFGVYAQRGKEGFMIRLRTPCGIISYEHMKLIQKYLKQYNIESIHYTSRQAVQLHDLTLDDVCEIMEDALSYNLFTRGGGGNYPRNVALSPMSGVEQQETFDVTDFAMQVSDYFIRNASTYHLPRKLKVAFSNSSRDTACATINDLGFVAVTKGGKPYFSVFMAGGIGKDPAIAIPYERWIEPEEAIYFVEAYIRMFIELGNYQNRGQARSRYIPRKIGEEEFMACFEKHLERVKKTEHFDPVQAKLESEERWEPETIKTKNLIAQKQKGLYTVILHPRFGKMSTKNYNRLIEFVDKYRKTNEQCHNIELRISMEEELYIRNLTFLQAEELLECMKEDHATTVVFQSYSCVGIPTCQIGIQNSRELLLRIHETVENNELDGNLLPKIQISGCPNSCTRHQVASLGFMGKKAAVDRQIYDVFEVFAGGSISLDNTHMGKNYGSIPIEKLPSFILDLGKMLEQEELCFDKFLDTKQGEFEQLVQKFCL